MGDATAHLTGPDDADGSDLHCFLPIAAWDDRWITPLSASDCRSDRVLRGCDRVKGARRALP